MASSTPLMEQYSRIKGQYPDAILFFRLGDFYEMFRKDAEEAAPILGITLTQRQGIPMCGVPYHAASTYVRRLLDAGRKVAICEQLRLPEGGRGLADRGVVEVVTPGTATEEEFLSDGENNYLMALYCRSGTCYAAFLEVSTGEMFLRRFELGRAVEEVRRDVATFSPRELLTQESLLAEGPKELRYLLKELPLLTNRLPDWSFDIREGLGGLERTLGVSTLRGFGVENDDPEIAACGVLLKYAEDSLGRPLAHLRSLVRLEDLSVVGIDEATQRNLELVRSGLDGSTRYTLLSVLDYTRSVLGHRLIKRWILSPLQDLESIRNRQDKVEFLYRNQLLLSEVRRTLSGFLDLERLASRVSLGRAHGKDVAAVRESLRRFLALCDLFSGNDGAPLESSPEDREAIRELLIYLDAAMVETPSTVKTEGNLIREGFSTELDELRALNANRRELLESYGREEQERSGIASLRIRSNRVLGLFFEVTKRQSATVPDYFIPRQSLSNVVRYTTVPLGELESKINEAQEKALELEGTLFDEVLSAIDKKVDLLQRCAVTAAEIDVVQSLAWAATRSGYTRPRVDDSRRIDIREGRHPVVEAHIEAGTFVPNSVSLTPEVPCLLVTGPDMAGKSTVLRQTALITVMAQMGSFVPAADCRIGVVDRVFCRVGASDNLARGESTFLVEMTETAHILRNASDRTLVIMDEVGRGTTTADGRALAQSVLEYLLEALGCRTLFATHFHELTLIEHPQLKNVSLKAIEEDGSLVFPRNLVDGPAGTSYGVHVAAMAGLPGTVVDRARRILAETKDEVAPGPPATADGIDDDDAPTAAGVRRREVVPGGDSAVGLFSEGDMVIGELGSLRLEEITPLEALNTLARWKSRLNGGGRSR